MHPLQIVKFIKSTAFLKRLDSANEQAVALLDAAFGELWKSLEGDMNKPPSGSFLATCRPRFDQTMMLMARHCISDWMGSPLRVGFYYFADGSPASGFEALSIVESILRNDLLWYRRLPMVYLGVGHMGLKQKAFAFLWAIFLEIGPCFRSIRWKLMNVISFCTDKGTEKGLVELTDILPDFCRTIGIQEHCERLGFLFPVAFWIPGWHHMWDGIVLQVLSDIQWFPAWLLDVKAVIKFLRIDTYRMVFKAALVSEDVCSLFLHTVPPRFAHWRWSTLHSVMLWLLPALIALRQVWVPELFKHAQDKVTSQTARSAVHSTSFFDKFRVVYDIVCQVHIVRKWGAGCACHEPERLAGKQIVCCMSGRRLPHAWDRLLVWLGECRDRSRGPKASDLSFGRAFLQEELGRTRTWVWMHLESVARYRSSFLDHLPAKLARARDCKVLRECRDEYQSMAEQFRPRVGHQFFKSDSPLKALVDESIDSGRLHHDILVALEPIEKAPLAEDRGEQTHAEMSKEATRARVGKRAWHASSMRLPQNLLEFEGLTGNQKLLFSIEFQRVRRILQVDPLKAHRRQRNLTTTRCNEHVYRSSMDVAVFGADVTAKSAVPEQSVLELTSSGKSKAEYLNIVLKRGGYYSLGPSDDVEFVLFQLVWRVSAKLKGVSIAAQSDVKVAQTRAGIVKYTVARSSQDEHDCFVGLNDVEIVDLLTWAPFTVWRQTLKQWVAEPSDIMGCILLRTPHLPEDMGAMSP